MTSSVRPALLVGIWFLVAGVTLVAGLYVAGGAPEPNVEGLPSPEPFVAWGVVVLRLLTTVLGLIMVGVLVVARWSGTNPGPAPFIGLAWIASAMVQVLFVLANVLALPLSEATSLAVVWTYAGDIAATRALLAAAAIVFIVSFALISGARLRLMWIVLAIVAATLPSLANHVSGLGDHALALTGNVAHAASATLWVGVGLIVLVTRAWRKRNGAQLLRSYANLALTCWLILAASGVVNGYVRLEMPSQLLSTGYGQLLLAKATLLIVVGVVGWRIKVHWAQRQHFFGLLAIDIALLGMAVGFGVALAASPYPRLPVPFTSLAEALLGTAPPGPPTVASVALGFRLDPVFALIALLGLALVILHWSRWPRRRRLSWLVGIAVMLWATNGGLAVYALVMPGAGIVQVAMLAGPVGLLLARGWYRSWPNALPLATVAFIVVGLLAAALGGWSVGSYVTRTLVLVSVGGAAWLFFGQLGGDRRSAVAAALVMIGFAIGAFLETSVAPWYQAIQPIWLEDLPRNASAGALIGFAMVVAAILIGMIWRVPDLPVSVDRSGAAGKTEPS